MSTPPAGHEIPSVRAVLRVVVTVVLSALAAAIQIAMREHMDYRRAYGPG